jgi:protoheme IX farnesyltransferase
MTRDLIELTKPRITVLILICAAVGYFFGLSSSFHLVALLHVLLGTALMASGTAALNQWYESDCDAKMRRTRNRPIAAGRVRPGLGFAFGVLLSAAGFADLWVGANPLTAWIGLFTLATYIGVYTPLKRRSAICTTVGALPGALPPLIGYAAASGSLDARALALFLILFVWQFPHFYAIAWMHREDYARGGIRMLPVIAPDGESTARRIVAGSILLIPVSLLPLWLSMSGLTYAAVAIAAGFMLLYFGLRLDRARTAASARHVLLASVLYLPAVLAVMVLDHLYL